MITNHLCHINDLEESQSKSFRVASRRDIFIIKKDGAIHAYENRCPHLGIDLNWVEDQFLDIDHCLIQCSTHGALFLIESGECVSGPCLGQKLTKLKTHIDKAGYLYIQDSEVQDSEVQDSEVQDSEVQDSQTD